MNPLRLAGHILLWLGFLAGAYFAVIQLEVTENAWRTVDWPRYGLAMLVGVVGVALLRATGKRAATHRDKLEADIQLLATSVQQLLSQLEEWLEQQSDIDVFEIHRLIDARLMKHIDRFVTARETLIHTYGLQPYVDVMSDFSIAERNINRAWSASADGYVDEVWASLARAREKLQLVAQHLAEQAKQHPATASPERP